jgi:hypothetical protein
MFKYEDEKLEGIKLCVKVGDPNDEVSRERI